MLASMGPLLVQDSSKEVLLNAVKRKCLDTEIKELCSTSSFLVFHLSLVFELNLINSIDKRIVYHTSCFCTISVVNCGDPGTPSNGQRYGDTFTYASQVILECDPSFKLVGDQIRTCQANGQWSGSQSTCQRKWWQYFDLDLFYRVCERSVKWILAAGG